MKPVTKGPDGAVLSVVIVSFNTSGHLRRCLESLERHPPGVPWEVVVIDNASTDGSATMVADGFPSVTLIRSRTNDGYGVAINRAVSQTRGEWLLFLNPDIEVTEQALDTLLEFARARDRAGVVGPRLVLSDGTPQASARRFPSGLLLLLEALRLHLILPSGWRSRMLLGTYSPQDSSGRVPWLSGACHLIPRVVWDAVGRLTEETFCGFDDLDYCKRAWDAGFEVWLCSDATLIHHCSVAVRQRWSAWEVEQVAIHSAYVVIADRWSWWRVKTYALAEALAWVIEIVRDRCLPRFAERELEDSYRDRVRRRLGLTLRLLVGIEQPRRRFEPQRAAGDAGGTSADS